MAKIKEINPLSEEFLYDLYFTAFKSAVVCGVLTQHMAPEYLPDKSFQKLNKGISTFYKAHKEAPSFGIIIQKFSDDDDVVALIDDIRSSTSVPSQESILATLEKYIISVKLQNTYVEIGRYYNAGEHEKAVNALMKYNEWVTGFTLSSGEFVDVIESFEENYNNNKSKIAEMKASAKKPITRFYIDDLDSLNDGRNLRGQCSCFLASTGVGKSHMARHIGKHAAIDDGLNVLHIQLEGSKEEVVDAYSGSLIGKNGYYFERGKLTESELQDAKATLSEYCGTIKVRAFTRFNNKVSTVDIKNSISEYRKSYGFNPDVVIVDSMDLLTDSSNRNYGEDGLRHQMIAVSRDLKDLANDEDVWLVVTYQATIEKAEWINDSKNVLTEYSVSEAKGISRALTHLISLNVTQDERIANLMRLHVCKSRFFQKGDTFKIATRFDNEIFYDRQKTFALKRA